MTTTMTNDMTITKVGDKEFFHYQENFYELMFWSYYGTKFYLHLEPQPFHEEGELDDDGNELPQDMEVIRLPLFMDEEGSEMEVEQVIELYNINPKHVVDSVTYRDSFEEEYYDWNDGERNEENSHR